MRLRHAAGWSFLLAPVMVASFGCPPHELRIEITPEGAKALTQSCVNFEPGCTDGTDPGKACCNTDVPLTTVTDTLDNLAFQIFLVNRRDGRAVLGARSACLNLQMNCFDLEDETARSQCFADAMNRAMNDGLDELAFDGMDREHVDVVLSMHAGPGSEAGCDAGDVFACALLLKLTDEERYDIVCADCTGSAPDVNISEGAFNIEGSLCGAACFVLECQRLLHGETL